MNEANEETVITRGEEVRSKGPQNVKERFYEKLRMPLWVLDTILIVLGVAIAAALILGAIAGSKV